MGNQLRDRDPSIYRLITIRTEGSHLWMKPSKEVRKTIGGVIARYSEILQIEIYALNILSNHPHFIIRSPLSNSDEFLENVDREIAKRINWINHRTGKFWARRYSEQEIISEDDLLKAFLYVTTNAVKHGLVSDPADWPGLSSYRQSITEKPERYSFYHYSAKPGEPRITTHTLKITSLPQFKDLPKGKRIEAIKRQIAAKTEELVQERKAKGLGFLGVEAIRTQDPNSTPLNTAKSPRPVCYTENPALRKEFIKQERDRRAAYREASMRYRLGDKQARFPIYTFKPPTHRKPRLKPFQPLPDDFFKNVA